MSARVLNPAMMADVTHKRKVVPSTNSQSSTSTTANNASSAIFNVNNGNAHNLRAADKAKRHLFGPIDHAETKAYVERELRNQQLNDMKKWNFDFLLEMPTKTKNSRYEWEIISPSEYIPKPYACRGMPYLRRNSPSTPVKSKNVKSVSSNNISTMLQRSVMSVLVTPDKITNNNNNQIDEIIMTTPPSQQQQQQTGTGASTTTTTTSSSGSNIVVVSSNKEISPESSSKTTIGKLNVRNIEKKTKASVSPRSSPASKRQTSMKDFMQTRKRICSSPSSKKSTTVQEPPESIARNEQHIRS